MQCHRPRRLDQCFQQNGPSALWRADRYVCCTYHISVALYLGHRCWRRCKQQRTTLWCITLAVRQKHSMSRRDLLRAPCAHNTQQFWKTTRARKRQRGWSAIWSSTTRGNTMARSAFGLQVTCIRARRTVACVCCPNLLLWWSRSFVSCMHNRPHLYRIYSDARDMLQITRTEFMEAIWSKSDAKEEEVLSAEVSGK